ncbi:MAG: HNH endonuclease [Methanobrevibacter sp.]|nr:HNH endonuclease [Methanobrevibacter sp.]
MTIMTEFGSAYIDQKGYYRISSVKEGNNGKRLHRLIMKPLLDYLEKKYPEITWVVHHKNKNSLDNRFENLQIMSNEKHNSIHMK